MPANHLVSYELTFLGITTTDSWPGDSDVSRLQKVRRFASPKGAAEDLLDAAFAVELFEVGQAELVKEVLGGTPACSAAIGRALFGTRDQLLWVMVWSVWFK